MNFTISEFVFEAVTKTHKIVKLTLDLANAALQSQLTFCICLYKSVVHVLSITVRFLWFKIRSKTWNLPDLESQYL